MRRSVAAVLSLIVTLGLFVRETGAFSFSDVVQKAQALAKESYHDTKDRVPQWMLDMTYDEWRDIRFRTDRSLWRDQNLPFEVQFFHLGLYYPRPVSINVVDAGRVEHVRFSPTLFDYGRNTFADRIPEDIGFAGFRVHYPIKTATYKDEVIVFLGASYFRAVGRDQVYGLSARGLAINTVEPEGEEFPYFTEFWLERPTPQATTLTLYALMDSPSVTGAFYFFVVPGTETRVDVEAHLFFRSDVKKLGLAPLTSMFFHGENTARCFNDFRPEVHDSDGLLLFSRTGEWLWRPLDNPTRVHVSAFELKDPRGFGLLQRDRDFEHYQDLEARSELRPSVWQEVYGNWGEGWVELVELPTDSDIHDNIVAYWRPRRAPRKGDRLELRYTIFWYGEDRRRPPGGRVVATRQERTKEGWQRFVVDFAGETLCRLDAAHPPEAVLTVASGPETGEIVEHHVVKNPVNETWRLSFQLRTSGVRPVDLRAFLRRGDDVLTETWSYTYLP